MFFEDRSKRIYDGKKDCLNITDKLHYFLGSDTIGLSISFKTSSANYMSLLSIFYKESFVPDFFIGFTKGILTVITKHNGCQIIMRGKYALNDGVFHHVTVNCDSHGFKVYVDGNVYIQNSSIDKFCEFDYVGFAFIGKCSIQDNFCNYFEGIISDIKLSQSPQPLISIEKTASTKNSIPLFYKGLGGMVNYRIPSMVCTKKGTLVATVDARADCAGDSPNHIIRAVRRSVDKGVTWSDVLFFCDYGGKGIESGASVIDGSMVYDNETDTIHMIFTHKPAKIGSQNTKSGSGFKDAKLMLYDKAGDTFLVRDNGIVEDTCGNETEYCIGEYDTLYKNGKHIGSICCDLTSPLKLYETSYLQIVSSVDDGKSFTSPRHLNPQIKKEWMKFLGAGPGTGIQIAAGKYKGRLIFPIYLANTHDVHSSGVIYSDDAGKNWHIGGLLNDNRLLDGELINAKDVENTKASQGECQLAEISTDHLRMHIRNNHNGNLYIADSFDGGLTWQNFKEHMKICDPGCQTHFLKAVFNQKDIWLISHPDNKTSRVQGVVELSCDGKNFTKTQYIEHGEFAYSCMAQIDNDTIGILYEGKDLDQNFTTFKLDKFN